MAKELKFKRGDFVKVVADTAGHCWRKGGTYEVESVTGSRVYVKGYTTFAHFEDVQKVEKWVKLPTAKKVRVLTEENKELLRFIVEAIGDYYDDDITEIKRCLEIAFKKGNYAVDIKTNAIMFEERN